MRSRSAAVGLVAGLLLFAVGAAGSGADSAGSKIEAPAPVAAVPLEDGTRVLENWQKAADIALANNQFLVAYTFYKKIAAAVPDSRVGRVAIYRSQYCLHRFRNPDRFPRWEDWWRELYETLTW